MAIHSLLMDPDIDDDKYDEIHYLCHNTILDIDETVQSKILTLLVDEYPESAEILFEDEDDNNSMILPIHWACRQGTLDAVKNLLIIYPESINAETVGGWLPIHYLANSTGQKLTLLNTC